jgi:hypothetical protein
MVDGRRRLEYAITAKGTAPRGATVEIPAAAFTGPSRVSFQEIAAIGYEKLRREIAAGGSPETPPTFVLSLEDIEQYRPRRRAAGKKA